MGTSHVFKAITDCTLVVLLTKKWNDCDVPIVHENMGMGDGDHGDPTIFTRNRFYAIEIRPLGCSNVAKNLFIT